MNVNRPAETFITLPGMRVKTGDPQNPPERRLHGISWMPVTVRHLFIGLIGEFVGTFLFLFFAFAGTQVANEAAATSAAAAYAASGGEAAVTGPNASVLMYISLAFGFSLAVNAWVFFRITGGLFNPAVSLLAFYSCSLMSQCFYITTQAYHKRQ